MCVDISNFFTASVVWGMLGLSRFVGFYKWLPLSFLAGPLFPLIIWFANKKWPESFVRYLYSVLVMYGGQLFASVNFSMSWPTVPIGYLFMAYIKTRFLLWWSKYNDILISALTAGIAISAIVQFLALEIHGVDISTPFQSTINGRMLTFPVPSLDRQ